MSDDEPTTGGGNPKAGLSPQQPRPNAPDEPADTNGTRSFGEPTDSGAPPKA